MAYFSTFQYQLQSSGVKEAYIANWQPNIIAYFNNTNQITALSVDLDFEKLPCNVELIASEDLSSNSKGSFIYAQQIQINLNDISRNLIPKFDGVRTIILVKTTDNKIYIYGLDTGLRLRNYSSTTGNNSGTNKSLQFRLDNVQRTEYQNCTLQFFDDVVQGALIDAPENLQLDQ